MKKNNQVLIQTNSSYIRIAQLKDDLLSSLYLEELSKPTLVGAIYKAQVLKPKIGLDACFVSMDPNTSAFLYMGRKQESKEPYSLDVKNLKKNNNLMVQVIKDSLKGKNLRVSAKISLPGTYLVYLPNSLPYVGVSRQIEEDDKREKLISSVQKYLKEDEAIIIRTKAKNTSLKNLEKDLKKLRDTWEKIQEDYEYKKKPGIIWSDVPLYVQLVRDLVAEEVTKVYVDDEEIYEELRDFIGDELPKEKKKIILYKDKNTALFDKYNLEFEIEKLLHKKVRLKSGGFIVIEETEAATVVDVNSGNFVGKKTPEDNILKINLESAREVARQLRLRNCGGIILIDFIDLEKEDSREELMACLSEELAKDRVPTQIFPISEIGVVQLTRKRVRSSLLETLSKPCPTCKGRSYVLK